MSADASDQLLDGLVVGGGDTGVGEDLGAQLWLGNTKQELLLLGGLGGGQVGNKEVLEGLRDLVLRDELDIFQCFFCSLEGLEGSKLNHL